VIINSARILTYKFLTTNHTNHHEQEEKKESVASRVIVVREVRGKFLFLLLLIAVSLPAQDFGFGFDDEETGNSGGTAGSLNVSVSGEAAASIVGYINDFSDGIDQVRLGDIFTGKLNFSAQTSLAEGVINLNLNPSSSPIGIDEAYVRVYPGSLDITAGLRKLTWGKADSFGPLDVINPLDTSEIYTVMADQSNLMGVKIARPLVHISFRFGQFSKVEGVFVPWFQPHRIAETGRWADSQMGLLTNPPMPVTITEPDTTTLNYAQGGIRFTTTIGSSDIGAQYYYGRLPQPSVRFVFNPPDPTPQVDILYNPYHQIGFDYAQVLFGFNTRAELAANITEDLKGDDGSIYNPSIAWSLGFDRDIVWGINLNLQINESIRLFHGKTGSDDPMSVMSGDFDIEGGLPLTNTRLTATVSKKIFRDELELRTAVVWGMEDSDCVIMPALIWTKDEICFAFSGGFFAGNSEGQLGQYRDNHFLKVSCTYTF